MGVTEIARGGQSNNVSVMSLCETCNHASAKDIIVLPNNKNIIMTAEKVKEIFKDATIHIVPTKSMAEGYLALSLIDINSSCEEIEATMNKALEGVHTGLIAKADKRGTYNGIYVENGGGLFFGEIHSVPFPSHGFLRQHTTPSAPNQGRICK